MPMKRRGFILTASAFCITPFSSSSSIAASGRFIGKLDLRFLPNGRDAELLADFAYQDSNGSIWYVPKGTIVNGSSIPSKLWSLANASPYVGLHRHASVIHDHYCDTQEKTWAATHRVYYDACLTSGMNELKAKAFYYAVYLGGPRWALSLASNSVVKEPVEDLPNLISSFGDLEKLVSNLSIEQIEHKADQDRN